MNMVCVSHTKKTGEEGLYELRRVSVIQTLMKVCL